MKVKDLIEKFKVDDDIPKSVLNIEIEDEINNFKEFKLIDEKVYSFKGEYGAGFNDDRLYVDVTIDLKDFSEGVLENIDDTGKLSEIVSVDELESILFNEAVIVRKRVIDNFYAFITYNIFGGLIRIS